MDAYFEGVWKHKDDQDNVCVNSRYGCVVTLEVCPLHCLSNLRTYIYL